MKKLVLGICGVAMFASAALAGMPTRWIKVISSQTISGTNHSTATVVDIQGYKSFGYYVDIAGTAPDVSIEYQVTYDGRASEGFLEGVPCLTTTTSVGLDWVTPATDGTMDASITANQADAFAPCVTKYLNILVTGVNSNDTDTQVDVYLGVYSEK